MPAGSRPTRKSVKEASTGTIGLARGETLCEITGNQRPAQSVGERPRQPEPREHAALEAGHGADPVAGEGEDQEAGPVADAVGCAQVGAERRLTVGPRRHEVEPAARPKSAAQKRATASRPWYSRGIGGIEMKTSSVSRATSASRSADSHARTNCATSPRSAGESASGSRFAIGARPAAGAAGWRGPA